MEGGSFTGMCCWFGCRLINTSNDENNYHPNILLLQTQAITILIARFYKVNALVFFFLATAGLVAANCLLHYTDQVFILQKIYHWLSFIPHSTPSSSDLRQTNQSDLHSPPSLSSTATTCPSSPTTPPTTALPRALWAASGDLELEGTILQQDDLPQPALRGGS